MQQSNIIEKSPLRRKPEPDRVQFTATSPTQQTPNIIRAVATAREPPRMTQRNRAEGTKNKT